MSWKWRVCQSYARVGLARMIVDYTAFLIMFQWYSLSRLKCISFSNYFVYYWCDTFHTSDDSKKTCRIQTYWNSLLIWIEDKPGLLLESQIPVREIRCQGHWFSSGTISGTISKNSENGFFNMEISEHTYTCGSYCDQLTDSVSSPVQLPCHTVLPDISDHIHFLHWWFSVYNHSLRTIGMKKPRMKKLQAAKWY